MTIHCKTLRDEVKVGINFHKMINTAPDFAKSMKFEAVIGI